MTNTEISNNNPEKELIIDKSISDDKNKQISKKNTTQNKKISLKNDKSNKSFDEISNNISIISVANHSNIFKFYASIFEYWDFANDSFCLF